MKAELHKTLALAEELTRRLAIHSARNEMNKGIAVININYTNGVIWTIKRQLEDHKNNAIDLNEADLKLSQGQADFRKLRAMQV